MAAQVRVLHANAVQPLADKVERGEVAHHLVEVVRGVVVHKKRGGRALAQQDVAHVLGQRAAEEAQPRHGGREVAPRAFVRAAQRGLVQVDEVHLEGRRVLGDAREDLRRAAHEDAELNDAANRVPAGVHALEDVEIIGGGALVLVAGADVYGPDHAVKGVRLAAEGGEVCAVARQHTGLPSSTSWRWSRTPLRTSLSVRARPSRTSSLVTST